MNAPARPNDLTSLAAQERQQGRELAHESALLHVTGVATYTDDIPEVRGTLYAALVLSPVAHGELVGEGIDRASLLVQPNVVAVFTAKDIPGENNCGPVVKDVPFLAAGTVEFLGQPVAVVVASSLLSARQAAKMAVVAVKELPAVLSVDEALAAQSFVMPSKSIKRGQSDAAIANSPHRIQGRTCCGQQEHFYLEGQIAYAIPREDGQLTLYASTQHPDGTQREAAAALKLLANDVEVICRRMGGAFGGKEGNSNIFSQSAALAAFKLQRPVKLRANRDDDMKITGKRHDFRIDYDCGFDGTGRILGLDLVLASGCGSSGDYSSPVNDRALLHIDNCYYLPHLTVISHRCKTNLQSSTAFRGFGGPQGMFAIETVIEEIAHKLGKDPLEVRRANLYCDPAVSGDAGSMTTQYGQPIEDWVGDRVIDQVAHEAGYRARREAVTGFNAQSKTRKRGLALVPLKFGISFTATMLNQGAALVNIYQDGSVSVNHGGTEMGQGLNTKMAQVVADGLGIDASLVRVTGADTQKVPNASATAASCSTDINGAAINNACDQLRARLRPVAARLLDSDPAGVKFAGGFARSMARSGDKLVERRLPWQTLVKYAWMGRVGLSVTGFYATPGIRYDASTLQGQIFYYFCYGAAVSEVEIDTRTGEWWLKAVDIVHDVGTSINPAIDKGQIAGAYVQGMGWLTMEECIWDRKGRLLTHGPSTYKIPVASDVPEHFNISLFDGQNIRPTPNRSKAVGEPPLMLSLSAYFALRDAISASAGHRARIDLMAPATPQRILLACERARLCDTE